MNARTLLTMACLAGAALTSSAHAQATGDTLKKIKETGSITLGFRESSIPFSYLDGQQKPVGISIDLCDAIVAKVKQQLNLPRLEVKQVAVNSSNRIPLVANGTVDIECGGTANNAARQKQASFSVATFVSQPVWLVRTDAGIKQTSNLKGKTVVVTQGSNAVAFARKVNEDQKLELNIIQAKDHAESMLTLDSGRAVAWLEDDILVAGEKANARNPGAFALVGSNFDNIYYGLMFRKDDAEFKTLVDGVLGGLMKSGEFDRLYKKWFESPIPPRNMNLAFPMSDKLKERVKAPSDKIDG
ncbi:transporter substrate-binding domain-containing protein [Piscinibacter sp.]|uniref:transporter substrate-binding domain-containing protein n=1 Tax=Piscinibacter sp. TaxID=1903157 RepID=UPI0039E404D6